MSDEQTFGKSQKAVKRPRSSIKGVNKLPKSEGNVGILGLLYECSSLPSILLLIMLQVQDLPELKQPLAHIDFFNPVRMGVG